MTTFAVSNGPQRSDQPWDRGITAPDGAADIADALLPRLSRYPHFALLKGRAPTEDGGFTRRVLQSIAARPPCSAPVDPEGLPKLSFTRIQIAASNDRAASGVTHYSRTNQPLTPHTDSSYAPVPHELVAFQMVRADAAGGRTLLAAVEDVVGALAPEHLAVLRRPVFPFGRGRHAIISGDGAALRVRYYRRQIETALKTAPPLNPEEWAALLALDTALARPDLLFNFQIEPGETLFLRNNAVLHGRTGFSADSDRLMYRFRVNAGRLA